MVGDVHLVTQDGLDPTASSDSEEEAPAASRPQPAVAELIPEPESTAWLQILQELKQMVEGFVNLESRQYDVDLELKLDMENVAAWLLIHGRNQLRLCLLKFLSTLH